MALAEEESLVPCVVGELVGELAAEVGATEGIPVDGNGLDEKEDDIVTTRWGVRKARERYRLPINYVGLIKRKIGLNVWFKVNLTCGRRRRQWSDIRDLEGLPPMALWSSWTKPRLCGAVIKRSTFITLTYGSHDPSEHEKPAVHWHCISFLSSVKTSLI